MSSPLAAHTLHRLASLLTPSTLFGRTGAPAPPAAAPVATQVDPLVVGALLVTVGVIYAFIILAAVCMICWPRRLKWPASAQGGTSGFPSASRPTVRPAGSHRPLAAHRAAGAHPPTGSATLDLAPGTSHVTLHATPRVSHKRDWPMESPIHGSAVHDGAAWPTVEREVEGVGLVRWDGKTVRAFAGQPEVLQRLAFQRWRYQEGRCSEFAGRDERDAARSTSGGAPRTPSDRRHGSTRNETGQQSDTPRQPGSQPPQPSTGSPTRVTQPTGGGAGPA